MSTRRNANEQVAALQKDLKYLKQAAANPIVGLEDPSPETNAPKAAAFDTLTNVEKSAASLGVHPDAWKPIAFMNNAHYTQLITSNALDGDLARRIESYRTVAQQS